mgnify:CR=1 FL=1
MSDKTEKNFGEQPIKNLMTEHGLKPHDLVSCSPEQMTHKMVSRAVRGRKLTLRTKLKVLRALNGAARKNYTLNDLFNYD